MPIYALATVLPLKVSPVSYISNSLMKVKVLSSDVYTACAVRFSSSPHLLHYLGHSGTFQSCPNAAIVSLCNTFLQSEHIVSYTPVSVHVAFLVSFVSSVP